MKYLVFLTLILSSLYAADVVQVEEKYQKSDSCKACHLHIVKEWENSWHANSHFEKDAYFKATLKYVSRKTRKSLNGVKVQCATCHNPRISVTSTDMDYEIMAVMNLDKGSKVNKAIQSDSINEGINCVVCHNIDKIHDNLDESKRGINRVTWMDSGVMSGPYDNAHSPFHKVEHRDFMNEKSNQLCFVCHANDKADKGFVFTNMQKEFKNSKKLCVDCHMGEKKMGFAASLRNLDGEVRQREVRAHGFEGAHTQSMWKDALKLSLKKLSAKKLQVTISNPQPHNIPSGFGSRELILNLTYQDKNKQKIEKNVSLTTYYKSKRGKATIPHLAVEASKDLSIPANGKRVLKMDLKDGANEINVKLYYRLVNDEVRSILKLKDEIFSRKMLITETSI